MAEGASEQGVSKGKIVIIDDQLAIRNRIRSVLEVGGYEVVGEADDGDQAVGVVEKCSPDIVLMDYVMERMDGITATTKLREVFPSIKVIMLTTEARPSVVAECLRAGAVNFVIKPFKDQQLLNATRGAMNR